jgi:ankyrin repeat protein
MEPQPPSRLYLLAEPVLSENIEDILYDTAEEIESQIKTIEPICFKYGFKQHSGQCWNDSVQMFFCFQDGIKEIVQSKLISLNPENIIRLAEFKGRKKFLPQMYKDPIKYETLRNFLLGYISTLQKRFILYLKDPDSNEHSCITGINSPQLALIGAKFGDGIGKSAINLQETSADAGNKYYRTELLVNALSFVFLDNKDQLCVISKYKSKINPSDAINLMGSINNFSISNSPGHATAFFECNKIRYHYDDNISTRNNRIEPFNYIDDYFMQPVLPMIPSVITYDNIKLQTAILIYKYTDQLKIMQLQNFLFLEIIHNKITIENFDYYVREISKLGDITTLPNFDKIIVNLAEVTDFTLFSKIIEYPFFTIDSINNATDLNNTPLLLISCDKKQWDRVSLLINKGVSVNTPCVFSSPLLSAIPTNELITIELLKRGANPNFINYLGSTPLFLAIEHNKLEIIKELLRYGANLEYQNMGGDTALITACVKENLDIIRELLDHRINPDISNNMGETALIIACQKQSLNIIKELLTHGADPNHSSGISEPPLIIATKKSNLDIVRELLVHNANHNITNYSGENALIIASINNNLNIIKELLNSGMDPNINNYHGENALIIASRNNQINIINELLNHGANRDYKNRQGETALSVATSKEVRNLLSPKRFFGLFGGYYSKYQKYINKLNN